MIRHFLFISAIVFTHQGQGALPPSAQKQLNRIGGKLTVDFVLAQAMKSSDTFKSVIADQYSINQTALASRAPTDIYLSASGGRTVDETQNIFAINNSNTDRFEATTYSIGLNKGFVTGTQLGLSLEQNYSRSESDQAIIGNFDFDREGYESKLALSLSQPLIKNSFGYSTKRTTQAGRLTAESRKEALVENVDQWATDLVDLFYSAWTLQNQVRILEENIERKKRLVNTTKIKLRRGTAERPDLLQSESAVIDVENDLDQARQQLGLPSDWATIDPMEIPLELDRPHVESQSLCGSKDKISQAPASNPTTRRWKLQNKAAQLSKSVAKNSLLPEVNLEGQYYFNGLDAEAGSEAFGELTTWNHDGYYIGVSLSFPLSRFREKAEMSEALTQSAKASAMNEFAKSNLKTQWLNSCHDLFRLAKTLDRHKEALSKQSERVRLEERRYSVGRGSLLQVIQAGDEASFADINVTTSRVDFRRKSWEVKKLNGDVSAYLEALEKRFKDKEL